MQVYGADKVWRQLLREGIGADRACVESSLDAAAFEG